MMSLTAENVTKKLMDMTMNRQANTKHYPILMLVLICALFTTILSSQSHAEVKFPCQELHDTAAVECALKLLGENIPAINNQRWRDQSYREYAKQLLRQNKIDEAIGIISAITSPDTQFLTSYILERALLA